MYMQGIGRRAAFARSGALSRLVALSCLAAIACGGSVDTPRDPDPPPGSAPSSGVPATPAPSPGGGAAQTGPFVEIFMTGATTPFSHGDGLAGATPIHETIAVKKLALLRSPADPSPLLVFDHGAAPVEVELTKGARVPVAKVPARGLASGVFTYARVGVSYARYAVPATLHTGVTAPVPGRYENVQALSDGAPIDGVARKKGYFRYAFVVGGTTYGTLEGEDAPTPVTTTTGGIGMDLSGPETFYVFPVQIAVDPNVSRDVTVDFTVNVSESFRWSDQPSPGYAKGVFDTTPSTFEPVMAFGANAFTLTVTP